MTKAVRDVAPLALTGLVIGIMLGILAAGGNATWAVGGDLANIGFGTILAFAPASLGAITEPFDALSQPGEAFKVLTTPSLRAYTGRRAFTPS